jgi:hypothetical protein
MGGMTRPPRRPHEIAIDHVVLPPGTIGTARVRAAIARELARLIAEAPAGEDAALPSSQVRVKPGSHADSIGVAVARQIHAAARKDRGG